MKRNHMIGVVIAIVIVAGGAFYAGDSYAKGQAPARGGGQFFTTVDGAAGFAGRGTRGAAAGFTAGKIISAANGSISIQMQNGSSSEIVLVGSNTQILKSVSGTASDLTVGANVTITGTPNSDGSMSATAIQIRPAGTGFPARGQ